MSMGGDTELLRNLAALTPEDLERDASELFGSVAWDKETVVADGEATPMARVLMATAGVLRRHKEQGTRPARRIEVNDL